MTEPESKKEAVLHASCDKTLLQVQLKSIQVLKLSQYVDPYVFRLIEALEKKGCFLPVEFFKCKPCPGLSVGAYYDTNEGVGKQPDYFHPISQIVVCEDNIGGASTIGRNVVHELIHAYDDCRAHISNTNCVHIACTEVNSVFFWILIYYKIRAANLSGDCHFKQEALRGNIFQVKFVLEVV